MPWSWSNIDWNGTGAMVQAIGSVLAIGAAIWIDQGSARRLRDDRIAAERAAMARRLAAIVEASSALQLAANDWRSRSIDGVERIKLSSPSLKRLNAAKAVLDYHMQQTAEVDLDVLSGLALASAAFDMHHQWVKERNSPIGPQTLAKQVERLDAAARELSEIHEDVLRALAQSAVDGRH